jgi:organic radical activating enzyme
LNFTHHFLQPLDGADAKENEQRTVKYCLEHPRWKLSLQTHKILGLP